MHLSSYQEYSTRPARGFHFHLLSRGDSNPKLRKLSDELGILPFALSLAPYTAAGAGNVCPLASPGCSAVCLNYAGRGRMTAVQRARVKKTRFWFSDRPGFLELLTRDLEKVAGQRRAAVRLNVFSDIPWERFLDLDRFPRVQFYDYTKITGRLGRTPRNYYLTFSLSETNEPQARQALARGLNVAVPFREPPARFLGYPVIDGDTHDYRFLDPQPVVIALKPKGLAKNDTTGFVREDCPRYRRWPARPAKGVCCTWCDCQAVRYVRGNPVCRYHKKHGEKAPSCPYCARCEFCGGPMYPPDVLRGGRYCTPVCALFARELGDDPDAVY